MILGAVGRGGGAARVLNLGPATQLLALLPFVDLTCHVYSVFGDRGLATTELELIPEKLRLPGDTWTSNFTSGDPPLQPSVAEVDVMLETWRFVGGSGSSNFPTLVVPDWLGAVVTLHALDQSLDPAVFDAPTRQ
jgi:hypothetical protein